MAGQRPRSRRGPWSKHFREFWERQASNPKIPMPVRVFSLAYARHGANGHTPLGPGELARILSKPPTVDRPIKPCDRTTLYRAIEAAKRSGYLDDRSSSRCLIVPQGQIQFGVGEAYAPCEVCMKRVCRESGLVAPR
jgi:hypothetical protein